MVSSDDYGRDLNGVHNLKKKHKRLDNELAAHEPLIEQVLDKGQQLMATTDMGKPAIGERMQALQQSWTELKGHTGNRYVRFSGAVDPVAPIDLPYIYLHVCFF